MALGDLGISAGGLPPGPAVAIVECFLAIALYNVIELSVIIFTSFKRRTGLYFWSFVVATWGIAVYSVGFLTKDLSLIRNGAVYATFIVVGWTCMVTGQSIVLWSRMHLLVRNKKVLRATLAIIIADAIIGHVPTSVVLYGSNSPRPQQWLEPYAILERFHVTIFFIQELAISTIYIIQTMKLLRVKQNMPAPPTAAQNTVSGRRFLIHLIYINVLVVLLDITILATEYAGLYVIQTAYKGMVYSVKLKLEFSILNSLLEMTRARRNAGGGFSARENLKRSYGTYRSGKTTQNTTTTIGGGGPGLGTCGSHMYWQLTQTVDEDGTIRYTGNSSRMGNSVHVTSQHAHGGPEPVHLRQGCKEAGDEAGGENGVLMTQQIIIRRDRREDWEESSNIDELVLGDGVLLSSQPYGDRPWDGK